MVVVVAVAVAVIVVVILEDEEIVESAYEDLRHSISHCGQDRAEQIIPTPCHRLPHYKTSHHIDSTLRTAFLVIRQLFVTAYTVHRNERRHSGEHLRFLFTSSEF